MKYLLKKISQSECVFQLMLDQQKVILPLHLVTSTGFLGAKA